MAIFHGRNDVSNDLLTPRPEPLTSWNFFLISRRADLCVDQYPLVSQLFSYPPRLFNPQLTLLYTLPHRLLRPPLLPDIDICLLRLMLRLSECPVSHLPRIWLNKWSGHINSDSTMSREMTSGHLPFSWGAHANAGVRIGWFALKGPWYISISSQYYLADLPFLFRLFMASWNKKGVFSQTHGQYKGLSPPRILLSFTNLILKKKQNKTIMHKTKTLIPNLNKQVIFMTSRFNRYTGCDG